MLWIYYTAIATVFFSFCVLLDKAIHTNKIKRVYSYAVVLNSVYLVFIIITTYMQWDTFVWGKGILYSTIAGCLWFAMWIFFWKALKGGEASRVSAVFFTQPIFAALFGVFALHESLSMLKWIGVIIIVIGAMLSSLGGESNKKKVRIAYLLALCAALLSATANTISKFAMAELPPLTVNCIAFYSTIPLYLLLMKDKHVREEIKSAFGDLKVMMQFFVRGLVGYGGIMLNMIAIGMGPISLVSAIGGSQPLVILLLSVLASFFFPKFIHEELRRKALIPKLAALVLTVMGVVMISI